MSNPKLRPLQSVKLRSLQPDDLDRVSEIERRIAGRSRKGFLEKRLAVATATPDSFITCAALDGERLLGYSFARLQEGDFGATDRVAVLDIIGVDPDVEGKGIGMAMMSRIEQLMKKKNIPTLRTQVGWADQGMISFFSSSGFNLAPCQIIERTTSPLREKTGSVKREGQWQIHGAGGNACETSGKDRLLVRSLREEDLAAVVRIDGELTGLDRSAYYDTKFKEVLVESGIRVSLVAEDEGSVAGFVMARVDLGEFGKIEKAAEIDTVGVHPSYGGTTIVRALLSQLLANLSALKVESVRTQLHWEDFNLQRSLHSHGFGPSQRLVLSKTLS